MKLVASPRESSEERAVLRWIASQYWLEQMAGIDTCSCMGSGLMKWVVCSEQSGTCRTEVVGPDPKGWC